MAFSKVKTESIADSGVTTAKIANDAVVASKVDDDGTGFTVGNLTNSGTLQQTGQVTLGSGGTNWTLPTARGTDKYVLQINGTSGAADWAESLTAPELSGHNFDVSGSTDDGGINAYEAPYELTGTTNETTTISAINTTNLLVGQYISGAGIPADTTISAIPSPGSSGSITISNQATASGSGVALKIQKTPGEKNGGKVTLTGANFGAEIGELSVAITNSGGGVIANASYLSGLSGGTSITAEWTGTEGTYSTSLTSSYAGSIYFKITKSGLASNVHNTNATLTSDPSATALSGSSQTGGDISTDPTSSSLGVYGSGRTAGGAQDSDTKLLLNFDRTGGTDIEDSSNIGGDGHKVTVTNQAKIKSSPFGDGKSAMYFDGSDDKLELADHDDWDIGSGDYTVEFWVYDIGIADNDGFLGTQDSNGYSGWLIRRSSGELNFNQWGSSAVEVNVSSSGSGIGSSNTWRHIAFVRHGNFYKLYIDGKNNGSVEDSSPSTLTNSSSGLTIGAYTGFANMYMDEIRIVKGLAVYTGNFTVPTSRLTTTWAANPYGGSNTVANSTAANTKLLIHSNVNALNTHRFTRTNLTESTDGLVFNGSNSKLSTDITSGNTSSYDLDWTNDVTIEMWLRVGTGQTNNAIWKTGTVTSSTSKGLTLATNNTSGALKIVGSNGGSAWNVASDIAAGTIAVNNTWTYILFRKYEESGTHKFQTKISTTTAGGDVAVTTTSGTFGAIANTDFGNNFDFGFWTLAGSYTDMDVKHIRVSKVDRTLSGQDRYSSTSANLTIPAYDANVASDANTVLLYNQPKFQDSATSGTTHTITATGAGHSENHGGIAPAMPWPANGKAIGSAGIYLDGSEDDVNIAASTQLSRGASDSFTFECWFYMTASGAQTLFETRVSGYSPQSLYINFQSDGWCFVRSRTTTGPAGIELNDGGSGDIANGRFYPNAHTWYHIAVSRSGSTMRVYVNGRYLKSDTSSNVAPAGTHDWGLGHSQSSDDFAGYIDQVRWSNTARYTHETLGSGNWPDAAMPEPTRAYGAYGQNTPDVGTITLTATGDGNFTWSEVAGGTALPGTLAVGSTTKSGSGNSATHTATITGKLPVNPSTTYTNGVKGDTATNNILLKVQHDTDATKAVTLNGTTGLGITQKSSGRPVLFNVRRYEGNQTNREINGYGFAPDFVWLKNRDTAINHCLFDSVRGATKQIDSNTTGAETTQATMLTAFNKDGFSHGTDTAGNKTDEGHMAWGWKAGGAPSATGKSAKFQNGTSSEDTISTTFNTGTDSYNTASGHVTSVTRSVNVDGGFSIVKYVNNGTGANRAIPHGLGSKPDMIILKPLITGTSWLVFHQGLTSNDDLNAQFLRLNAGDGEVALPGSTSAATDYHFYTPNDNSYDTNTTNSAGVIAYCWKDVTGVSKYGTYAGNASTNSITVGFKPKFMIIKRRTAGQSGSWSMWDYIRDPAGDDMQSLYANGTTVEQAGSSTFTPTLTPTGFSFDANVTHASLNANNEHYVYLAWA